jgi:hypothetical protein
VRTTGEARAIEEQPAQGHAARGRPAPRWWPAALTALVAGLPPLLLAGSVLVGGGPKAVSDDIALLVLGARDALHGGVLLGPYSRYGWHHPGPSYFYLLAVPTWLWHNSPTGIYVVAPLIAAACAAGTALLVRRGAGAAPGWVAAGAVALFVAGVGGATVRDPWNPYVVALPVLLAVTAGGLGAAGVPGALPWAAVAGTLAVQTHVSTAPVVGGVFAVAVVARVVRRVRRGPGPVSWWRPETWVAVALLVAAWVPPLWDEAFGTGNLDAIWRFFTAGHPTHGWGDAWRAVAAVFEATFFQHHAVIEEGVAARHAAAVTAVFVALAVSAVVVGAVRRRPVAAWLGVAALLAGGLAVESVTRVVGPVFRYLVVWMAVLPVVPVVALAAAVAPGRPPASSDGPAPPAVPRRPAHARTSSWTSAPSGRRLAGVALVVAAVLVPLGLALRAVAQTPPVIDLTDNDIQSAYRLVAPAVGPPGSAVRIEINDGGRWPAAAGVGLELVRHGYQIRVQPPWTLLFGDRHKATGHEPSAIVVAGVDPRTWPPAARARLLGRAGPEYLFVRRP